MRRSDDTVDKLRSRLKAFHQQTQPVIDYYKRTGKNVTINADQDKDVSDFLFLISKLAGGLSGAPARQDLKEQGQKQIRASSIT